MSEIFGLQSALRIVDEGKRYGILSTGASAVNFSGGLYNVTGSTHDPPQIPGHENESWKRLLINLAGLDEDTTPCYVTNPGGEGSHPNFSVGGHMTTVPDGVVATGGICYLMPLCYWHNSTSRDGVLFGHELTRMVKLTGYNQGELAATFEMRLPSPEPYSLLYYSSGSWRSENLSESQADQVDSGNVILAESGSEPEFYALFSKSEEGQEALYKVEKENLPEPNAE